MVHFTVANLDSTQKLLRQYSDKDGADTALWYQTTLKEVAKCNQKICMQIKNINKAYR